MSYQAQRDHEFRAMGNDSKGASQMQHQHGLTVNTDHSYYNTPSSSEPREQNRYQVYEDSPSSSHEITPTHSGNEMGGLGVEIVSLLKKTAADKKTFRGKRKPLGDVKSNGNKLLQMKAKDKQELQKIQSRMQDTEFC
mmetsp:Transcript_27576/g.44768  ORF Transcript_27576/g.44768 Transcript_27576/m.44768 type:complete len:138 (-) Transcript_27576:191-604(-)